MNACQTRDRGAGQLGLRNVSSCAKTLRAAGAWVLVAVVVQGCGATGDEGLEAPSVAASMESPTAASGAASGAPTAPAAAVAQGSRAGSSAAAPGGGGDPVAETNQTPARGSSSDDPLGAAGAAGGQEAAPGPAMTEGDSMTPAMEMVDAAEADEAPDSPPGLELPDGTPTLFWLDITSNAVTRASPDGSGAMVFASGRPLSAPDGVAVDPVGGHVFVLNMGNLLGGGNRGSLVRYELDGSNAEVIMPAGSTADGETFNTGKQISIDRVHRKLYMGDREGAKVWRCDFDGGNLEVLVSGHGFRQIVGVAPDPLERMFYFTDRNDRKLLRASMDMPTGQTHADRDDVELLYHDQAADAMPLDIELDVVGRTVYWTDRRQDVVFSMGMDMPAGEDAMTRSDVKRVATGLNEAIGLAYDRENGVLFATHNGNVSAFEADGSGRPRRIGLRGRTGIAFTKIP